MCADPGLCETYVDEPSVYFDDGGCIVSENEDRVSECVIDHECCVVVVQEYCGV